MSEHDAVQRAQEAVGSADTIEAAAFFEPRGTSGGTILGEQVGNDAGRMMGGGAGGLIGAAAGAAIGFERGRHSGGFSTDEADGMVIHDIPFYSMVAVSPTRIYGWKLKIHGLHGGFPEDQLFALDRSEVTVEVHGRMSVRTLEVAHPSGSEKWEFESQRATGHMKPLLNALKVDAPAD